MREEQHFVYLELLRKLNEQIQLKVVAKIVKVHFKFEVSKLVVHGKVMYTYIDNK